MACCLGGGGCAAGMGRHNRSQCGLARKHIVDGPQGAAKQGASKAEVIPPDFFERSGGGRNMFHVPLRVVVLLPEFLGGLGGAVGERFGGEALEGEVAERFEVFGVGREDEFAEGGDFLERTDVGEAGAIAAEGFEGHRGDGGEVDDVGVREIEGAEGEVSDGGEVVDAAAGEGEAAEGFHFGEWGEVAGAALGEVEDF